MAIVKENKPLPNQFKQRIGAESQRWLDDGIINQQQAEAICQRYGRHVGQVDTRFSLRVLEALALLFVGLGLITLIGANWQELPRLGRMLGLITLTATVQGLAWWQLHQGKQQQGVGLLFLGNICFGAGLILTAQIYHLGEHMPDGIFWWALGCLPVALLVPSRLLMLQTLLLALLWFGVEADLHIMPSLMWLFLLAAAWQLRRGDSSHSLLLLTVVATGLWLLFGFGYLLLDDYSGRWQSEQSLLAVMLLPLALALSQYWQQQPWARGHQYGPLLGNWTIRVTVLLGLIFTFDEIWRELLRLPWRHLPQLLLATAAIAITTLLLQRQQWPRWLLLWFCLTALGWLLFTSPAWLTADQLQIASNLLLVGYSCWLVHLGIQTGYAHHFYLGLCTLLLVALLRYTDLIGDYVSAALLFLLFALLLFAAARFWHKRHGHPAATEPSHDET
ncbi:DUF2157 domain-containing protein [uncultured Ferrimonas sp.]|uniref:DUF2157 domain-containing protein n=1 Tax=uncultured Ferrimonas sp. TaxID=432640 RepID=UPI00262AAB96|nr:DUF2157 domain-containing protein [uncultured Ferrimonas sp.]